MSQNDLLENEIIAGIDIEPEAVQISWYGKKLSEPETVSMQVGVDKFKIPLCVFYREKHGDYQFGQVAIDCNRNQEEGVFIPNLYKDCVQRKSILINEKSISEISLLQIFLQRLVQKVKTISGANNVAAIVFTAKNMDEKMIDMLKLVSGEFEKEGTEIIYKNYEECYISYLLSQPIEAYARDSVLFYMRKGTLDVYHIVVEKKFKPYNIYLQHEQIDGFEALDETFACTDEEKEQLDKHFCETMKKLFGRAIVSTVYLTGDGFDKEWMNDSLRFLCQGRRVFQGKNLFTKGACFNLLENYAQRGKIYNYNGKNNLNYKITIPMWQDGNNVPFEVFDGKGDYYQLNKSFECLLDGCEEIVFEIVNIMDETDKRTEVLELYDIPDRPKLGTKIRVDINALSAKTLKVKAKDRGLGEFFPSSDKCWEKEIIL